jgi:hypothetical protein
MTTLDAPYSIVVRGDKTHADQIPVIWWHMYFFVKVFLYIFVLGKTILNLSQDNWMMHLSKKSELLLLMLAWFIVFLFLLVVTLSKHHSTYTKLINFPRAATDTATNLIVVYKVTLISIKCHFPHIHLNWNILTFLINCRDCQTVCKMILCKNISSH